MLIKDIEIRDIWPGDASAGRTRGIVAFLTDDKVIHFTCHSSAPQARRSGTLRRHLISDGVRQLRRMPEFRAGNRDFHFAPGLV